MELKIIKGNFIEGERVTLLIGEDKIERKVYYSKGAGDLYVMYKNNKYFYYEFMKGYTGDA